MQNKTGPAHRTIEHLTRACVADPGFLSVLRDSRLSLIASVRPDAIACFGARDGVLTVSATPMALPIGIAADGTRLAVGLRREIAIFARSARLAEYFPGREGYFDAVYTPIGVFRTGECLPHDLVFDGPSVVFANTQFSCLSRADLFHSFAPLWRPHFISALTPDDRCHLNSFAMDGRRVRYATAFGVSDTREGHRALPNGSGVLIDVEANAVVATGLHKPHSVRVFDGAVYVLNSAAGEVLKVDVAGRRAEVLAVMPGFTRGMRMAGGVLFVGLSTLRASARQLRLPLADRAGPLMAGIAALELGSGRAIGMLRLPPEVEEIYDIALLPGVSRACVLDPAGSSIGLETPAASYWMVKSNQG